MCTSCGCSHGQLRVEGQALERDGGDDHHHHEHGHHHHHHSHHHGHDHHHHGHHDHHDHDHDHQGHGEPSAVIADSAGDLHYGQGPARSHAPGLSQRRMVQIEQNILAKNDQYAAANRARLASDGILALNLVSSPGSGKTTLLTRALADLQSRIDVAVIEGDQETANDAERIRETGVQAIQINTGKGCHLDAHMVGHALDSLKFGDQGLLFIENVGNLVCPASFDLGEAHKVAILSVTEGEDKPLKYPDMFHAADLLLLNKVDLLPHLDFDVERCIAYARQVNPDIEVIRCSARSGEGLQAWYQWLEHKRLAQIDAQLAPLQQRLARLARNKEQCLV